MGRREKSVWKYFERFKKDSYFHAKCNFCGSTYMSNPQRMEKHLTEKCQTVPKAVRQKFLNECGSVKKEDTSTAQRAGEATVAENNAVDLNLDYGSSSSTTPSFTVAAKRQKTISGFVDSITRKEKEELDQLLARALFSSAVSHQFVENKHFIAFMKKLRPAYNMPSRTTIATTLLDKEYSLLQKLVADKIRSAESVALLSVGWADVNGISPIHIVFTTPEPVFYRAIDSKTESHTAEYIASVLGQAICDVGPEKVGAVLTDSAPNMKCAWSILKEKYGHLIIYGCTTHGLKLLFKDVLAIPSISKTSAQVKDIIKFFRNKQTPREVLKELQMSSIDKEIQLVTSSETRWGSICHSYESVLKNKDFLQNAVFHKSMKPIMTPQMRKILLAEETFWLPVNNVFNLLKPIADAVIKVETDRPGVFLVNDAMKELATHIAASRHLLPAAEFEQLCIFYENRCTNFIEHPVQRSASLLRYNEQGSNLDEEEQLAAIDFIFELASKYSFSFDFDDLMSDVANYRAKTGLWASQCIWINNNIDPLTWWLGFFPKRPITKIASIILRLPATAAGAERSRKAFSQIHAQKRNKLTVERAMKLAYVKFNLQVFEREDIKLLQTADMATNVDVNDHINCDGENSDLEMEANVVVVYDDHLTESQPDPSEIAGEETTSDYRFGFDDAERLQDHKDNF